MSRNFRTFLFIFFVSVFVIVTPSLVLYAQGYRINWPLEPGKKLVVKTGGFFVKTTPKQADVYINGKLREQTDFFFGSALLENFLPRQYQVEIKKTGYQTWGKNLEIKEKEVTEIRNVTLFPEHLAIAAVEKNVFDALISPDGKKIALREQDDNGWNLKLYDTAKGVISKLAGERDFSAKGAQLSHWSWKSDSKNINIDTTANGVGTGYAISIEKNPARISKSAAVSSTSTEETTAKEINGNKYYLNQDGFIYKKDPSGNAVRIGGAQITVAPDAKYRLWVFGDYYFIAKNSELYVLKPGTESLEKIFDNLSSDMKLSPDGKKAVYASESEIWVFFLKDKTDQPTTIGGNGIFITRLSEKISNCDWYNSDYIIFTAGGMIKTAEIDNRDKINIASLANFSGLDSAADAQKTQLIWDGEQKSAYLFFGNTLYKSQPIQ